MAVPWGVPLLGPRSRFFVLCVIVPRVFCRSETTRPPPPPPVRAKSYGSPLVWPGALFFLPGSKGACLVLDLPFSMLRSCFRSVPRCATVAMKHQARAISCTARTPTASPAVVGRGSLHASPALGISRRSLSTLTDEQLRRKMDEFNDLFVTVSLSEQWYSLSVRKTNYCLYPFGSGPSRVFTYRSVQVTKYLYQSRPGNRHAQHA